MILSRIYLPLLVLILMFAFSESCAAQVKPVPAGPRVTVSRYDKKVLKEPRGLTQHTWLLESVGVDRVDVQVWHVVGGTATRSDSKTLLSKQLRSGSWRLILIDQTTPIQGLTPGLGFTFTFADKKPYWVLYSLFDNGPEGFAAFSEGFSVTYQAKTNEPSGFLPDRPGVLYAAITSKTVVGGDDKIFDDLQAQDPKLIEKLAEKSAQPGTAFVVLTLTWKSAKATPRQ